MPRKEQSPEQVFSELRQVEVAVASGTDLPPIALPMIISDLRPTEALVLSPQVLVAGNQVNCAVGS